MPPESISSSSPLIMWIGVGLEMTVRAWPRVPVTMISDWEAVSPASSAGASCAKAGMEMAAATQDAPTSSLVYFCMVLLLHTENRSPGEPAIFLFSACFGAYPAALNLRGGVAVSSEKIGNTSGGE